MIGRGVVYHKTEETDLCCSATVETGVLFIGRGVAYRKRGLHDILFTSTVDLQHNFVSSVLRYATPLPINRTPVSTVGGPFPPFCGTPDPSR